MGAGSGLIGEADIVSERRGDLAECKGWGCGCVWGWSGN